MPPAITVPADGDCGEHRKGQRGKTADNCRGIPGKRNQRRKNRARYGTQGQGKDRQAEHKKSAVCERPTAPYDPDFLADRYRFPRNGVKLETRAARCTDTEGREAAFSTLRLLEEADPYGTVPRRNHNSVFAYGFHGAGPLPLIPCRPPSPRP